MNPLAEAAAALAASDREDLHARAADADAPPRERVIALAAIAIRAARGACDPDGAELLDDAPLVDAALAAGLAGAVTGLALALGDALPAASRRYLAKVVIGAGATGVHVASLCLAAGEPTLAARAAAAELDTLEPEIGHRIRAALAEVDRDPERFR